MSSFLAKKKPIHGFNLFIGCGGLVETKPTTVDEADEGEGREIMFFRRGGLHALEHSHRVTSDTTSAQLQSPGSTAITPNLFNVSLATAPETIFDEEIDQYEEGNEAPIQILAFVRVFQSSLSRALVNHS